jgi:hypothetical protein
MADKYTHDELVQKLDEPGWRAVSGNQPQEGTLRQMAEAAHDRHKAGGAAGLIQHIASRVEVDALQLEELWYHLGLPLV